MIKVTSWSLGVNVKGEKEIPLNNIKYFKKPGVRFWLYMFKIKFLDDYIKVEEVEL